MAQLGLYFHAEVQNIQLWDDSETFPLETSDRGGEGGRGAHLTKPREMVSFSIVLVARFLPCCQQEPGTR